MVRLTKKEARKIAERFNLGRVSKLNSISEGLINFNYELETDKGEFIVRMPGRSLDQKKLDHIKLQFRVIEHLSKRDFPYKVPVTLRNKYGNKLSRVNRKNFWIYEKLPGKNPEK